MTPFTVVTIGLEGAGKTLFLSSMFQQLMVPLPRVGFHLEIPDDEGEKRVSLTRTFLALADPNRDWPEGTRGVEDWKFTCFVRSGVNKYPVFQITYLDFAGGILRGDDEGYTEGYRVVLRRVKEADAVLVLIDGHKMLNLMRGQSVELVEDLRFILPILNDVVTRSVHFAISKWDMLEDDYSLKAVRERLLEIEHFRGIIEQRSSLGTPTRLIPVSALGKGVARIGANGQMEKIPGASLNPKYVEMPLACTLVDAFESMQQEMQRDRSKFRSRRKRALAHLLKGLRLTWLASSLFLPPQLLLGQLAIAVLWEFVGNRMTRVIKNADIAEIASRTPLKESDAAIATAVLSCNNLMMALEKEEPYSNFRTI